MTFHNGTSFTVLYIRYKIPILNPIIKLQEHLDIGFIIQARKINLQNTYWALDFKPTQDMQVF